MPAFLHIPKKTWGRSKKPHGNFRLNPHNPFAQKLVFATPFQEVMTETIRGPGEDAVGASWRNLKFNLAGGGVSSNTGDFRGRGLKTTTKNRYLESTTKPNLNGFNSTGETIHVVFMTTDGPASQFIYLTGAESNLSSVGKETGASWFNGLGCPTGWETYQSWNDGTGVGPQPGKVYSAVFSCNMGSTGTTDRRIAVWYDWEKLGDENDTGLNGPAPNNTNNFLKINMAENTPGLAGVMYWCAYYATDMTLDEMNHLAQNPYQIVVPKTSKSFFFSSTWTAPQKLDISHIVKPTFVPSEKFRQSAILDYNEPLTQGVTFAADLPYDVLVAKTGQASDHSGDYKSYNFRYWTQFRRYKHKRLGMWHSSSELGMMQYLEDSGIILDGYDATVFVDFNFEGDDGGQWCGLVCRREFGLNDGCWQTLHDNTNNYFAYWYQNGGTKSVNFTGIGDAGWVSGDHIRYMLTRNSSNITLYYWNNGVLKIESQTTPAYAHIVGNAQNLSIGNTDTGNRPTHGLFTLTTLWDRCLSEAEAKSYIENPYQIFKARKLTSYSFPSNKPATPTPHGWLQG